VDLTKIEMEIYMSELHILQFSGIESVPFMVLKTGETPDAISSFELALISGIQVHPNATISTDTETPALSIEWFQDFPI
jgi:hypothetical protein